MKLHIRISTILVIFIMLVAYAIAYHQIGSFTCLIQQPKLTVEYSQTDWFPPEEYDYDTLTKAQAYELISWTKGWGSFFKTQFPILKKSYALLGRRTPTFAESNIGAVEAIAGKKQAEREYTQLSKKNPSLFPSDSKVLDSWSEGQKHELLYWLLNRSGISIYGLVQLPVVQKALEPKEPIKFRPMTGYEKEREIQYYQQLLNVQLTTVGQTGREDVQFNWNNNATYQGPPVDISESQPMTEEQAFSILAWAKYSETMKRYQLPIVQRAAHLVGYEIPTPEQCIELLNHL